MSHVLPRKAKKIVQILVPHLRLLKAHRRDLDDAITKLRVIVESRESRA